MKKIYLAIITLCICISAAAQSGHESQFMRFYVPDCMGSPFPNPVDTYFTISENGQAMLKIRAGFGYNAKEFTYFQKYSIPEGNNLYFKLDNGDIIALTCSSHKCVKDGFVTSNNGVYQNYADYSYFPVSAGVIDSLKSYNVIKVRGQFKFEIMDGSMQFTPESTMPETKSKFVQAEDSVRKKYEAAILEKSQQEALKEDPLLGF